MRDRYGKQRKWLIELEEKPEKYNTRSISFDNSPYSCLNDGEDNKTNLIEVYDFLAQPS